MSTAGQSNSLSPLVPVIPRAVTLAIVALTLAPFLAMALGMNLGVQMNLSSLEQLPLLSAQDRLNNLHLVMAGPQFHTLLEWSAIIAAVLTALLAFSQYNLSTNIAAPVIGLSLLCAASMDVFHSMVSSRLLDTVADSSVLAPFSWAAARTFNAMILLLGVSSLIFLKGRTNDENALSILLGIAGAFVILGYLVVQWCISTDQIPHTIYPDDLIKRPLDTIPLVIYIFCGAFVFPRFRKLYPSVFADALILSMLPAVAVEMHMVLGSSTLFDGHFFAAHLLKVLTYVVPFIGLLLDYYITYQKDRLKTAQLHQTYRELEERTLQLTRTNKGLERSNRYKSEFLASMSHELRTPLNSIIGFSRVLLKELGEEKAKRGVRAVEAITRNGTHLQGLMNNILDLSKMDAGRMSIHAELFSLGDVVQDVMSELLPAAEAKSLDFTLVSYARNLSITSDKTKLRQMLLNLGSNAIKYTHSGSVTLFVEQQKSGPLGKSVKFVVKDTGIGIAETEKSHLFTEFGRAEEVQKSGIEGTGLGLMITAKLASLLGGYIEFESTYGVGSEFRLFLPIGADVSEANLVSEGHWDRKGFAIAYFGDSEGVETELEKLFIDEGVWVCAEKRLKVFFERCEELMPDVIFFECDRGGIDPLQLLRSMYERNLLADIPKVGVCGNKVLEKQVLMEGADLFQKKLDATPVLKEKLYRLGSRDISSVLVVGASPSHIAQLHNEFSGFGIEPEFVDSTALALEQLSNLIPDLLVINLGNLSVETTRLMVSLNNDEQSRRIPQVLYNGAGNQRKIVFSSEVQEEVRAISPSVIEIFAAAFTMRRRVKTSLMRIEALNRSLKQNEKQVMLEPLIEGVGDSDVADDVRILVVEDSPDSSELIDWILVDSNFKHDSVTSGRAALTKVLQINYSLILLDIHLPDLDGKEVARRLRATKRYKSTPIVAITAGITQGEISELLSCGIDDVVTKPVDQEALVTAIKTHLPRAPALS